MALYRGRTVIEVRGIYEQVPTGGRGGTGRSIVMIDFKVEQVDPRSLGFIIVYVLQVQLTYIILSSVRKVEFSRTKVIKSADFRAIHILQMIIWNSFLLVYRLFSRL